MRAHAVLIACAANANEPAALALPGFDAEATRRLLARWFPGADAALGLDWPALVGANRIESRSDEIEEVAGLLRQHAEPAAGAKEASDAIAWALACASLGNNHLWQDLGLPSRNELSALIGHWFPSLAAKNTHNMKWKKFFYKQLCERENIMICKAPTCGVCSDHGVCFGPEDGHAVTFH